MAKKKITDLKFDDKNFNIGSQQGNALLEKSIQKFGFREAATVDKNGVLIGGNKRTAKAGELGFEDVEIIKADPKKVYALQYDDIDIDTPEGRSLALALNATAKSNIVLDAELVEAELGEAVCEEWGVESSIKADAEEDDYEIPDTIETDIVLGDLFEIGQHRLLCGDSTQTDTFSRLLGQEMADLVVTDPPYNVDYTGKTKDALKIGNDKMSNEDFYQFLYDFYTALGAYTKAGGAWYVWQPDKQAHRFIKAFEDSGYKYSGLLVWVKDSMVMSRGDYHAKHETCIYGWKEGAAHGWYSDRKQTTVLNFERPQRNAEHPTMKPIPLIAYQIGNSSKADDIVCDGFGGSGTTMVAAQQTKRRCRMMELDPRYCQVIIDRMRKLEPGIQILKNGKEI